MLLGCQILEKLFYKMINKSMKQKGIRVEYKYVFEGMSNHCLLSTTDKSLKNNVLKTFDFIEKNFKDEF